MKNYLMLILICMSFVATAQSNSGYAYFIGDEFHGLKMANTEAYDKNSLVAGHRSLPYGTKVKVTNVSTSKSVIVTIKDRGPFIKGGIIELSHKAGKAIGIPYSKTTKTPVRIEVVGAGETVVETEEEPVARNTTPSTYDNTKKGGEVKPKATPKTTVKTTKPKTPVKAKAKPAAKPKAAKAKTSSKTATATKTNTGVYKVEVQSVQKAGYGVQIGVFNDINATLYKVKQLTNKGFTGIYYAKYGDGYKIILKNYDSYDKATSYKKALKAKYGISGFVVEFSAL